MIDIEKIKSLPDDKPRKGPHKMSKSRERRCEVRRRYKAEQRARRLDEYYQSVRQRMDQLIEEEELAYRGALAAMGIPAKFFGRWHQATVTGEDND